MISILTASIALGTAQAQARPHVAQQVPPQFVPGPELVSQTGVAQQPFVDQSLVGSAQPVNFIPASPQGNQFQAYDTAYLASLNGRLPEWNPNFPVVENGYLVPILVDEDEVANLDPAYQWVDPSTQQISWYSQFPTGQIPGTVSPESSAAGNQAEDAGTRPFSNAEAQ